LARLKIGHRAAMTESKPGREAAESLPHGEEELGNAVDRIVGEGAPRLQRPLVDLLATGIVAGLEVSLGVVALLVVVHATGSQLIGGLAFSFGFVALLLGRSELFTEGFLVPLTVVAAGEARMRDVLRFWVGSAVGNLAGGWVLMWIAMSAYPQLHGQAVQSARVFIEHGMTLQALCLAILAGSAITLMTRMHNGTDDMGVRVFASVFTAFILAGLGLAHSILESLLIFGALHTGHAPFGYADWAGWFGWTVLGNMIGGIGLVTMLRLVRSRQLLAAHREENGSR
jgi:formate/nitrite transporter FocA (FNT family)